jgi:anti-sigma regulatory factor (Ser/Thr protein kinase)
MAMPAAGQAPGLARQATREVLHSWRVAHLEETAVLFVSELVTNAVRHAAAGGSMLVLRLEAAGTSLRIEVHDADPQWPRPGLPAGLDESGYGFVILDALASRWGVSETSTGKAVWAELDTRPGHQPG